MATTVSITRSHLFSPGGDVDLDNMADPGDSILTTIRIQNLTAFDALNVTVNDTLLGSTLVAGSIKITPIAFDDAYTGVTGNTPITYAGLQGVLANDVDPDGAGGNAGLTVVSINGIAIGGNISIGAAGTVNMSANGGFTYTPTTGFNGTATFNYTIVDAQNLNNVTTGTVNIQVNGGMVWYVDNAYGGENGASDGSYLKPFTNFNALNDNGTGAGGTPGTADNIVGDDDVDGAGSTIFVYHNSATHYVTGIALEAGQSLIGDGNTLLVNGHNIGGTERTGGVDNVATNAIIDHATYGVQLATDNIVKGVDLVGTAAAAIGIADGGASVTTGLNTTLVSNVGISGQGQIVDIDQGGKIDITLTSAASTSNANGAGNGAIDLNTVQGSFTVTGATSITGGVAQTGGGIDITNASGSLVVALQGTVAIDSAATTAINFQNNSTGTSTLTLSGSSKNIDTTSGTALNIDTNTNGTVTISGGGLDIDTTAGGKGLNLAGTAFVLTGGTNTIDVVAGQIMTVSGATLGAGGVTFTTLSATGNSPGTAIDINDLDGNSMTVTGVVAIANTVGANVDAINIRGGSTTNFNFQGVTDIDGATGDGVELNGANGTVTFANLQVDTVVGTGLSVIGATNAVTVTAGAIGATNDPAGDALLISGGTAAVTVGANITKTTVGGNLVDITGHSGGTINVTGVLLDNHASATVSAQNNFGIYVHGNTGGTINFTNASKTINTGANAAVQLDTNTGATINFTGGNLDIDTTSGKGFTATGGGTVTIQGTGNTITSTTGTGLEVTNTTIGGSGITLQSINVNGATNGIILNTTGAGGLTVTGTGTAGTGGTIQNNVQGALFTNASNISLTNMNFTNANSGNGTVNNVDATGFNNNAQAAINMSNVSTVSFTGLVVNGNGGAGGAQVGINGNVVSNLTIANSTVTGFGDTAGEGDVKLFNLTGTSSVTNSTFSFVAADATAGENLFEVRNTSGTLNLTMTGNIFKDTRASTFGSGGVAITAAGTAVVTANIFNNDFTNLKTSGVEGFARDTSTLNINVTDGGVAGNGNVFDPQGGTGRAVGLNAEDTAVMNFNINNNSKVYGSGGPVVNIFSINNAQVQGRINNNADMQGGGIDTPGSVIFVHAEDSSDAVVQINANTITKGGQDPAIQALTHGDGAGPSPDNATLKVTITNNKVTLAGSSTVGDSVVAIDVRSGSNNGDTTQTWLNIANNTVTLLDAANDFAFLLREGSSTGQIYLQNMGAGATNQARAESTWINNGNTPANAALVLTFDAVGAPAYAAPPGGTVPLPSNPLMAAFAPVDDGVVVTPGQGGEDQDPVDDGTGGGPGTGDPGQDDGTDPQGDPTPTGEDNVPPPPPPVVQDDGIVSQSELDLIVNAAIQRWADAGATPEQIAAMRSVSVTVSDMMGLYIGASNAGSIRIDSDGAGYGWFIDSTPGEDSEFEGSGSRLHADQGGAADHHIDLLTVVMHELGHQIGLEDSYMPGDASELMYGYLNPSERRLPVAGDADGAVPGTLTHEEYALGPIAVTGVLPGNKAVDIIFTSIVNNFSNQVIPTFNNTSTVEDSAAVDSFPLVTSAIDPLIVDTVSISSTIFIDANRNGLFDAGEGVQNVTLTLYADNNNNGVLDGAEATTVITTATSGVGGLYTFANLAEGNYVVSVNASNFNVGGPLAGTYNITGVPNDPDNNADNDDNGLAGPPGAVITNPITLNYNSETASDGGAIPKNDVNNTLDIGFVTNLAPDAVDDNATVAEDSGANDLTAQLLTNDTDPDNDTRTITSATQGAHGSTSVVAGVLTYTPAGNYNGTDTFTYTIDDGNGHTDTATVNVTVTAVNDPVTGTAPPTAAVNEDSTNSAITGMSISDVDATLAPAGVYDVTLSATHGILTLTTITGLTFGTGDGTGDTTMTFHGTLADINTALATAKYTPDSNYNGAAQISLQVTDTFGGTVATGTGVATNDTDNIAVTVTSVNDAPAGTDDSANAVEGSAYTFLTSDFSDGFSDPIDTPPNGFGGVRITTLPSAAAGVIKLNGVAISAGDSITKTQLDNGNLTFEPAVGSAGTSPTFTFQVRDDGGVLNGGVDLDQSPNTFTINIAANNIVPALDLDANDSVTVGTGYAGAYTEGGAASTISDTDVLITDADSGDDIVSAIITITNAETGDKLNVGTLPAGITIDGTSTDTVVKLVGPPGTTAADFEAAIEAITYSSTSDNPTDGGTNLSRAITVVVNDGQGNSNTATANIAITGINDAPANSLGGTIGTGEDAIQAWLSGMSVSDVDAGGNDIRVTLNVGHGILDVVTNAAGGLVAGDISGNGTATVILTGTQAEINATLAASNGVTYTPTTNYNGADTLTVTTNDLGATGTDPGLTGDGTSEETVSTRTITISASNDAPVVINGGTETATATNEDTPGAGQTVFDLFNSHYSDQADAQFSVGNPTGSSPGSFGGIAVTAVSSTAEGHWQYLDTNTSTWTNIDPVSDSSALLIGSGTQIRFNPAPNYNGPAPTLTAHLIDNSLGFGITFGQHADLSGVGATGGQTAYSTGTVALGETVNAVNDPPAGTSSTISATEDTARPFTTGDFGFTDIDSGDTLSAVQINSVTGGKIFYDADGAGGADPVEVTTFPATYSATDIGAGKLTYLPNANLNGTGVGSIAFQVIDSSGAGNNIDLSANTLTVDVTAINDSPSVSAAATASATEQVPVTLDPALTVSDADLGAKNGGNGDFAGATLLAANNGGANANDQFTIGSSGSFTVSGNQLLAGGLEFATFSGGNGTQLNIVFTSAGTPATTALVNAVAHALQYTNTSDTPPSSVDVVVALNDGSPGHGQGDNSVNGAIGLDVITVNITNTTEAPVLDLNGAGAGTSATLAYTENQIAQKITPAGTISDLDSANFNNGVLTLSFTANGTADDRLEVIDQGFGQGKIFVSGNEIYYDFGTGLDVDSNPILDPRLIGTFTGGDSGSNPLAITLTSDATLAVTQLLLRDIGYLNVSDSPSELARTVTYTLSDGTGNTSAPTIATINVTAVPDLAVAEDDNFVTDDNVPLNGNVFGSNSNGPDYDPESSTLTVTAVNGSAGNVGVQITLASGAKLTVNSNGNFTYDPNGKFNSLVPVDSGAVNFFGFETFTYTLNGDDDATVFIGLNGIVSPGDIYKGDGFDDNITGTEAPDFFLVNQGGNDNLSGLGGNDVFLFGAALTSADNVDGGAGMDQIAIQGNYSGGVTLGTGVVSIESLALMPGNDTRFGDPGTNFYDYNITTVDANVAAGMVLVVDASRLRVGEDVTFNGSAETNGAFFIYGGGGTDLLTGGAQNDVFYFGEAGQFGASDVVNGGPGGLDQLALRGDYTITFGAGQLLSIESIGLVSAFDTRFGLLGAEYDYNLTMNDANLAAGQLMTVDGATLHDTETLMFNGSAETNGNYRVFGGAADDTIVTGAGNDILSGGLGADQLTGGGGNDKFLYRSVAESTSAGRDAIQDFSAGDKVDLSQIDAILGNGTNDAFTFIGSAAFSHTAGELRATNSGPIWTVQGDINGDGVSDIEFLVVLTGGHPLPLDGSDFIL